MKPLINLKENSPERQHVTEDITERMKMFYFAKAARKENREEQEKRFVSKCTYSMLQIDN